MPRVARTAYCIRGANDFERKHCSTGARTIARPLTDKTSDARGPICADSTGGSAFLLVHVVGGGQLDLSGNVYEWVNDWACRRILRFISPSLNPPGPASGDQRIVRGGSFTAGNIIVSSVFRASISPTGSSLDLGFRCAGDYAGPVDSGSSPEPTPTPEDTALDATAEVVESSPELMLELGDPIFQLDDYSFVHSDNDSIETRRAEVDVADFILVATMQVPDGVDQWDFGVDFRVMVNPDSGEYRTHRVVIESTGDWIFASFRSDSDGASDSGTLTNLNTTAGATNQLRLEARGTDGLFFVNDALIAELDLSLVLEAGYISIGIGYTTSFETEGAQTHMSDFIIWEINDP